MKKKVLLFAGMILLSLDSMQAQAYRCSNINPSVVLTPPSITIPGDLPVGSLIGSELFSGTVQPFICRNSDPKLFYQANGVRAYGTYVTTINHRRIYSTNVAGVGYAVGVTLINNCNDTVYAGNRLYKGDLNNNMICAVKGMFLHQLIIYARIQFYKTAQQTGTGTVRARPVGVFWLLNNHNPWSQLETVISIGTFNIRTIACTVNNTVISVPMGTVEKREFGGKGTWPGDANTRNFTIPLSCNAGTRVKVQIDGSAQNASQGVLNLTGGTSSASGVGIQLLYNSAPLPLAIPINTGTASFKGAYSIPLQARYYQTGSNVTPGTANASATFTLTYQ